MLAQRGAEVETSGNAEAGESSFEQRHVGGSVAQGDGDFAEVRAVLVKGDDAACQFIGLAFELAGADDGDVRSPRAFRQQAVLRTEFQRQAVKLLRWRDGRRWRG